MRNLHDLSGMLFGKLTVLRLATGPRKGVRYWSCRCVCGKSHTVRTAVLINGHTTQCTACSYKARCEKRCKDLTGRTFGRLVVLGAAPSRKRARWWSCSCSCGKSVERSTASLTSGKARSCGCLRIDNWRKVVSSRFRNPRKHALPAAGDVMGRFTVLSVILGNPAPLFIVRCECCSKEYTYREDKLRRLSGRASGVCPACLRRSVTVVLLESMVGKTYSNLKVTGISGDLRLVCACACGNEVLRARSALMRKADAWQGCKACRAAIITGNNVRNRKCDVGSRYGMLTVVSRDLSGRVVCLCDCGASSTVHVGNLSSGDTRSCGCMMFRKGPEHPNWDPELSDEDRERNRVRAWKGVRSRVYSRDDYTCQACGERAGTLNAHHIRSWKLHPADRFRMWNAITLCSCCHKEFHAAHGHDRRGDDTLNWKHFAEWLRSSRERHGYKPT